MSRHLHLLNSCSFLCSSCEVPYIKYCPVLWSHHRWSCLWNPGRKHYWSWLWWWKSDCEWSENGETQRYCGKQWRYPPHWSSTNSWFWSVMCLKNLFHWRNFQYTVLDKHGESKWGIRRYCVLKYLFLILCLQPNKSLSLEVLNRLHL